MGGTASSIHVDEGTSRLMDALRGVSALMVASVHAFQIFLIPYFGLGSPAHITTGLLATHAVTTFFVVSGFMICISTFKHRNSDGSFRSFDFAMARLFRIYPPLISAILLSIAVYFLVIGLGLHGAVSYRLGGEIYVVRERIAMDWSSLPSTFFLLYGVFPNAPAPIGIDGPLWTLGFEWWFYVLAFVCARLWNGFSLSTVLPFAAGFWLVLTNHDVFFIWFLVIWIGGFVLGGAYISGALFRTPSRFFVGLALAIVAVALIIGRQFIVTDLLDPFGSPHGKRIWACVGLLIAVMIASAIRKQIRWRLPQWITGLSGFSYTLYIVHYPLLLLAYSLLHPFTHGKIWPAAAACAAASLVPIIYISALLARVAENRNSVRYIVSAIFWRPQRRLTTESDAP